MPEPSFLIDECLSPELAEVARARGFHALHAVWAKLGGRSDAAVAEYAIDKEMILVTNNLVDFRKIYNRKSLHPGLIFIAAAEPLMDLDSQIIMFEHALEKVEEQEPINEAILVQLLADEDDEDSLIIEIDRFDLPDAETPRRAAGTAGFRQR